MTSYQLDTNAILRYLTQDKPKEAVKVEQLFSKAQKGEIEIEISEPVFIETAVTLRNYYKYPKDKIVSLMETILSLDWIITENLPLLYQAIGLYATTSLDLIDCLIWFRAKAKKQKIFTFDKILHSLSSCTQPSKH